MNGNELLLQAAAQTIDALSFAQTYVIDEDFRAHSKNTINSVRSLQREQRSRVDQMYGPRSMPAETIAAQLMAVYRGETASLELAKEASEYGTVAAVTSTMTHRQCQAFKKEMKQRIHEWERAFREEHGVAVAAHEKAALRLVYELYKAAKNRLKETETPAGDAAFSSRNIDPAGQHAIEAQQKEHQRSLQALNGGVDTRSGRATGARKNVLGAPQVFHTGRSQTNDSDGASFVPVTSTTTLGNTTARISGASPHPGRGIPARNMSQNDLLLEKRYLKRVLHQFEAEFEQHNGHPPTKSDRRIISREYARYGELKNEIFRRSKKENQEGTTANDDELPAANLIGVTEDI